MNKSEQLIACLEGEIAKRDARIVELERAEKNDAIAYKAVLERQDELRAELAAIKAQEPVARLPACPSRAFAVANLRDLAQSVLQHDPDVGMFCDEDQAYLINELADLAEAFNGDVKLYAAPVYEVKAQGVVKWPEADEIMQMAFEEGQPADDASGYCFELEEFDLFIERLMSDVARLNASPVQQVSVPDGATLILGDTGRKDLDRLIDRLMSSDPDFEDCTAAAALLRRLFMEEISGPKGHATWKDAAVAERLRRVSMRPSETVVAMAREGLAVYSGPNMNEHKVCAEIVRLADISDTAMLSAAPAAPAADAWIPVSERLPNIAQEVIVHSEFDGVCAGVLDSYGEWFAPCSEYKLIRVTSWMPMPTKIEANRHD